MTAAAEGATLAQLTSWGLDPSMPATGLAIWTGIFLLAVIGCGAALLLRAWKAPGENPSPEPRNPAGHRRSLSMGSPGPIAEGVWIGTLEFEPQAPDQLLELIPLRLYVDEYGGVHLLDCEQDPGAGRVVAADWEDAGCDDQSLTLSVAIARAEAISNHRLKMRRESACWETGRDDKVPALVLRRAQSTAGSLLPA